MRFAAILFFVCSAAVASDSQIAAMHRERFPRSEWVNHFYATVESVPPGLQQDVVRALAFVMASNTSQPIMERCVPQRVSSTLYHFDLRNLRWDPKRVKKILETRNPYGGYKLVLRADWLIVELTDASESDTHYQLLYGTVPKTRADFLKFWGVSTDKKHSYGLVEGQSGVSVSGQRWLESFVTPRGYAWGTRDVFALENGSDPLEAPGGEFKHDGEEHIVGVPKLSITTGERGTLQAYFLVDGNGNRVDKADPDLVQDHSKYRGNSAIRTSGSCIQCHASGLNDPTTNLLRELIASGVRLTTKTEKTAEEIEIFHLSDIATGIRRANEDFATGLRICNGLTPAQNLRAFRNAVAHYDKPVTLEQAARELNTTPNDLKYILGLRNEVGARLAYLAEGQPIPRTVWEEKYRLLKKLLRSKFR